jgi:hypothetical protein
MISLDGEIRDGRHHLQVRVYYEDTDFLCSVRYKSTEREPPVCHFLGSVDGRGTKRARYLVLQMG